MTNNMFMFTCTSETSHLDWCFKKCGSVEGCSKSIIYNPFLLEVRLYFLYFSMHIRSQDNLIPNWTHRHWSHWQVVEYRQVLIKCWSWFWRSLIETLFLVWYRKSLHLKLSEFRVIANKSNPIYLRLSKQIYIYTYSRSIMKERMNAWEIVHVR